MTTKERTIHNYQNLTDREHAIQRASMYMGSVAQSELQRMIYNARTGTYELRSIMLAEGFETIFDEILVNAADQQNKDPKMNEIRVWIYSDHIVIQNNGQGLPLNEKKEVKSTKENVWLPTMLFGRFRSGDNFGEERIGGGLNGLGAKIVNCFSKKFQIETQDPKSKKYFSQTWYNNLEKEEDPIRRQITPDDPKGGFVRVTFYPDFEKFEMKKIDSDTMQLLHSRVWDVAGFMRHGISVFLNDELVPVRSFQEYTDLFFGTDTPRAIFSLKDPTNKNLTRLELAIAHSNDGFKCHGLINALRTPDGTHVRNIINDRLGKSIVDSLSRKRELKDFKFQPAQFRDQVFLVIKMTVNNPEFNSQRKTEFVSKPASWGFDFDFPPAFIKKLESSELGIVDAMVALKSFKEDRALAQLVKTPRKGRILDIPKLHDAENINNPKRIKTLVLTEGDSAKTLAVEGISKLPDAGDYGIYPLRGKILNVRNAKKQSIPDSEVIRHLMRILGLEWKKTYQSISELRYQRVLIFTDADDDGAHICGLFMNFIEFLWPSVLEANPDFCWLMISPIGKIEATTSKGEPTYFFTKQNIVRWREGKSESTLKKTNIKWLKGLASSDPKDAKYYFKHMSTFAVPLRYTGEESKQMINLVFSKNSGDADLRKEWINAMYDPDSELPLGENIAHITWPDFFNKQFIHFSVADTVRSLPSVMDGLKPSQRKILYTMFSMNITTDRRLNSLMGSVLERANYHHGDASVTEAIVAMAQRHIGTNNINLLHPSGIFGTRKNPRTGIASDHGAARYIFSRLEPISRNIFNPLDEALLTYNEDDNGAPVEPRHYMPCIPMVLVNGASGIGTGWSTTILKYYPREIVEQVRARLNDWKAFCAWYEHSQLNKSVAKGEEGKDEAWPQTMQPWYDGFTGSYKRVEAQSFDLIGSLARVGADTIRVTELPPEIYTDNWIEDIKKKYLIGASAEQVKKDNSKKKGKAKAGAKKASAKKANAKKAGAKKAGATRKRKVVVEDMHDQEENSESESKSTTSAVPAAPKGKGSAHEFIKDVIEELKGGNNVSVLFKCDPIKLAKLSDEQLTKAFGLSSRFSFTNVWAYDVNSKLKKFTSPEDVIDYFCYNRYQLYADRKAMMIEQLRYDSVELSNKRRYLEMVGGYNGQKPYIVGGKTIQQVEKELEAMGFDKLRLKANFRDPENEGDDKASYWYLGKLLQWSATEDKINKLRRECEEALAKLETLQKKTPIDLWLEDLDIFERAYNSFVERRREAIEKDNEEDADQEDKKKKPKKAATASKKRAKLDDSSAPKRVKTMIKKK